MTESQEQVGQTIISEVEPVLRELQESLRLLNSGLIHAEAINGLRMLEPRNDLSYELKQIAWCIARLNGMTSFAGPPCEEVISVASAVQRRTDTRRDGHQAAASL